MCLSVSSLSWALHEDGHSVPLLAVALMSGTYRDVDVDEGKEQMSQRRELSQKAQAESEDSSSHQAVQPHLLCDCERVPDPL